MSNAKKIYLAVAGGLVAAGIVLAGIGFVSSGFDPEVFNAQVDLRNDTAILGGVEVGDPAGLPLVGQIVGADTPKAPEAPVAP